ncbi:MAG: hypothetical protein ACLRFR_02485 [Clostridia bacterium]
MKLVKNPMFWMGIVALILLVVIMYKLQVFDGVIGWFENVFDIGGAGTGGEGAGAGAGTGTESGTQTE